MKDALPFLTVGFVMGALVGFCVSHVLLQEQINSLQREALERGYACFLLPDETSRAQFTWRTP